MKLFLIMESGKLSPGMVVKSDKGFFNNFEFTDIEARVIEGLFDGSVAVTGSGVCENPPSLADYYAQDTKYLSDRIFLENHEFSVKKSSKLNL